MEATTKANPAKAGDAKLRGYSAPSEFRNATPVEPPKGYLIWRHNMRCSSNLVRLASVTLVLAASACGDATDPTGAMNPDTTAALYRWVGPVARVVVSPDTSTMTAGASLQFSAKAYDGRGRTISGAVFVWSSSDSTVASVAASGMVSAKRAGSVVLSATDGSVVGKATVRVPVADTTATTAPTPTPPATASTGRWVSGYWVGYQRDQYPEGQIDFTNMTHILVGAIEPTSTGGVTTDFFLDATTGPTVARTISSRAHQAGRKAILMLGGSSYLTALKSASSTTYRATFVKNLLATMDNLGYDGIDVDWEPIQLADEAQALQLLKDLRAARPAMILTFPINWVGANSTPDTWLAQVAPVVDQLNVMTYEMAGDWGGWTSWHEGALYGESSTHPSSISSSIKVFLAAGVPAAKLGLGLGAYGSCWRGPTAPNQAVGLGVVASDNTMSYSAIVGQYYTSAAYHWDTVGREGYLSFASATGPAGCTMISYEDPQSITERGAYVKSAGLGGAIMWTINEGHVATAAVGQQDPLLAAAYASIVP
jgi:chitinase